MKLLYRNIAIVSAIFIVSLSIMLVANYFQVRGATPLQTEVVETLKQLNDANAGNPDLQEQIRQLDLLARKAYFVQHDRLITGVYILLGMLAVFFVCIRLYFTGIKDIPDKEMDPVDEWADKTKARRYVVGGALGLAATALVFVNLTPNHSSQEQGAGTVNEAVEIHTAETPSEIPFQTSEIISKTPEETPETTEKTITSLAETAVQPAVSKVTHNAFRGNNSNGISAAKNVPLKWDLAKGTNILWKTDVPRKGHSSPVINGDKVFFTGADEETRELYCYQLATGERLWTLAASNIPGSPEKLPEVFEESIIAASSAATNGNQVCAIFATGDLICADMDGNRLWAKNLGVPENPYGYVASLLTFGNLLIVQYDNRNIQKVMAFDLLTGIERWSKNRTEKLPNWASPIIAYINNTPQLALIGHPGITAYNPNNGEQLWRVECLSGEPTASACSANDIVFAASEYSKMVAINATDGSVLWESNEFLPETSSPVATKDNIYVATSYGVVASFDTQTGAVRTEHELDENFNSSPIIAEGKVYLFDVKGKMYIFSANNEFSLLDSFETGEGTYATPAFTDGKIVVRTEKSIYCVAAK